MIFPTKNGNVVFFTFCRRWAMSKRNYFFSCILYELSHYHKENLKKGLQQSVQVSAPATPYSTPKHFS